MLFGKDESGSKRKGVSKCFHTFFISIANFTVQFEYDSQFLLCFLTQQSPTGQEQCKKSPWVMSLQGAAPSQCKPCGGQRGRQRRVWCGLSQTSGSDLLKCIRRESTRI